MTGRLATPLLITVLFLCALLGPSVPIRAEGSADEAEALYTRYQALFGEKSWKKADLRMTIIRSLGRLPVPEARSALLKILRVSKSADEQLLAVWGIGSIADPEAAELLLKHLGKKEDPVLLHALSDGLSANADDELHAWLLSEGLGSSKVGVQRAVIRALGARKRAGAAAPLKAVYDENSGKRARIDLLHDVVRALGQLGTSEVTVTLLAAAAHEDGQVRLAAAEALALAWADDEPVVVALRTLLEDPEAVVRRTASRWIGESGIEPLVPHVIRQLEDPRLRNRKVAHDALVKIAAKDLGFLPDGWLRWWKDRDAEGGGMISVANYYGFQVFSDRVLFVVDTSGSMNWPWRWGPKRIEYAREKLAEALGELSEDTLFNIIAYSTKVHSWQRKEEVPATKKNVEKALKWIEKNFEADGNTHTYDALAAAFANNSRFDTVYLLSDGTPSHGRFISPEGIVTQVRVWNRYRRVVVNTVALTLENLDRGMPNFADNLPRMKSFMRARAVSTGGATKAIENAPKRENR